MSTRQLAVQFVFRIAVPLAFCPVFGGIAKHLAMPRGRVGKSLIERIQPLSGLAALAAIDDPRVGCWLVPPARVRAGTGECHAAGSA